LPNKEAISSLFLEKFPVVSLFKMD
jgi:hypothetical protein